jgi:hypothetical protein
MPSALYTIAYDSLAQIGGRYTRQTQVSPCPIPQPEAPITGIMYGP